MRIPSIPVVTLALLLPAGSAVAQDGPSFDCRIAGTATEVAICDSPRLARMELWVVEAYEDLTDRIGRPAARAIADEQLVRRQACQGDPACIEERLILTLAAFGDAGARVALPLDEEPAPRAEPIPPSDDEAPLAPLGFEALDPGERLALGPPREVIAAEPTAPAPVAPEPAGERPLSDATVDAGAVSTLGQAFAGLADYRRINVQGRLAEAGLGAAAADGRWGPATQAALAALALDLAAEGRPFDVSSPEGAADLLDFIDSDAFRRTYLDAEVALEPEW